MSVTEAPPSCGPGMIVSDPSAAEIVFCEMNPSFWFAAYRNAPAPLSGVAASRTGPSDAGTVGARRDPVAGVGEPPRGVRRFEEED